MRISIEFNDADARRFARRVLLLGVPVALIGMAGAASGVPFPPISGNAIKASEMKANFDSLEDRLDALEAPPPARTFVSSPNMAGFSLDSGAFVVVPYVAATVDAKGEFDPTLHVFQPKAAGRYLVCASILLGNSNIPLTELYLYIDGTKEKVLGASYNDLAAGCRMVPLNAMQKLDLRVRQSSGSTLSIPTNPSYNWMTVSALE